MNNILTFINSFDPGLIQAVIAVILFLFSSYFVGFTVTGKILKIEFKSKPVENIIRLLTGIDLFSFLALLLGSCGLITKPLCWIILIIAGAAGLFIAAKELKSAKLRIKPDISIIILTALFALLTLGSAISYPIGWDELVYHVTIPFRWNADGLPLIYGDNPFSAFPSSPEFLFWFLISAAGIKTVRLLLWSINIALISGLYLLLRDAASKFKAAVLVAAFLFSPVFMMLSKEAYVEAIILLNLTVALLLIKHTEKKFNLYKTGTILALMAASCINVKLTGIAAAAVIFIMVAPQLMDYSKFFKFTAFFSAMGFIFALPFYLRPLLVTGNPFYPYFADFFSKTKAALCMSLYQHDAGTLKFGVKSISAFLAAPLLLSFDLPTYDGSFGLQFLILLLIFLIAVMKMFSDKNFYGTGKILLSLFILYIFWFFSSQQARFLLPFLILFLFFTGQCINKNPLLHSKIFLILILVCTVVSIPGLALKHSFNTWKMSLKRGELLNYIYSGTGDDYLPSIAILCNIKEPDSKVLMLFDNRTLYIPLKCEIGTPFFQEKYFTGLMAEGKLDVNSMKQEIRRGAFTHIMISLTNKDPDRINKYLELSVPFVEQIKLLGKDGFLKKLYETGDSIIYQIQAQK